MDYYEAARIAYIEREYMRKFIEREINVEEINKYFRPLWKFTYKIVSGEDKERVKVVNKDPDNFLVQWVPGGNTITEIFKEMNKGCRSVLYY
jgi:methionine aminopeptidase